LDGPSAADITVVVTDSGVPAASSQVTFHIDVLNVAPSVFRDEAIVIVDEGSTAANSGRWSDPGQDVVLIEASLGTAVKNDDGTWTWSMPTDDGPDDSATVTITATDSDGAQSTMTFTLNVLNVAPEVAVEQPELTVVEGGTVENAGTWSEVGEDDVTLTASVGTVTRHNDGAWSWSFTSTDGPDESGLVSITATDSDGDANVATFTLVVQNAPPTITAANAAIAVIEGQTATNSGTFDDIGDDTITLSATLGTIVDNGDGTWTWSYDAADGPLSSSVMITATDSDGAATSVPFSLDVANAAPTVSADEAIVTVDEAQTAANSGVFDDVGDDVVTLTASVGEVHDNGDGTWSWSYAATDGPDQTQTVTITATDSDDAATTTTFELIVNNVAPTVAADAASIAVDEGQIANNSGTFGDVGSDVVTLTASRGEIVDNGDGTWSWSLPADDDLDGETITIIATDSDGAAAKTTFALTINNLPPTPGDDAATGDQGAVISGNLLVNDSDPAGAADPLTIIGSTPAAHGVVVIQPDGSFTYTPGISFSGSDSFTYTISDGDGGESTAMVTITVTPAANIALITDPSGQTVLVIAGTPGNDVISIGPGPTSTTVSVTYGGVTTVHPLPGGRIVVAGGDGDDEIKLSGSVATPAWLYGEGGNDVLNNGAGGGVLIGGDGNDVLQGGGGRDVMVGGQGADSLIGNNNDDILIAGYTTQDNRTAAGHDAFWAAVLAEWNSDNTFANRVKNLRDGSGGNAHNGEVRLLPQVRDDFFADQIDFLNGAAGEDWLIFLTGEDKVVGKTEASN
jgi:hypothetical protein